LALPVILDIAPGMRAQSQSKEGGMASAMVFVDDAVLGHFPPVCAKSGVGTPDHLIMTVPVGGNEGLGLAWLLVLAGPLGWLGLIALQLTRRAETLAVRLPYCDASYDALRRARRTRRNVGVVMVIAFLLALLVAIPGTFSARAGAAALAAIFVGLLATYITESVHIRRASVGVALDGSRRWVTLSRVSELFAASARDAQQARSGTLDPLQ
jgi:hypothetical protein